MNLPMMHLRVAVAAAIVSCALSDMMGSFDSPQTMAKKAGGPEAAALEDKFNAEVADAWEAYKNSFLKDLVGAALEAAKQIFINRFLDIIHFNSNPFMKYTLGINEFSHIAHDEFVKIYTGYLSRSQRHYTKPEFAQDWKDPLGDAQGDDSKMPESLDWRDKGTVSPVKNQKQCGSCWSFATTGSIESAYIMKNGKNISLSEQNLIDCSKEYGNKGCNGGSMDAAFEYIITNKGIVSEEDYPYESQDRTPCRFNKEKVVAKVKNYVNLPRGNERALQKALFEQGPIAIAINAGSEFFQSYQGGIYDNPDCNPDEIDHAVLLIGYGEDDGTPYWIIKNSWGPSWGMDGCMKVLRNHNNLCGLATEAQYPVLFGEDDDDKKDVEGKKDDKKDCDKDDKKDKDDNAQKSLTSTNN